ncbi:MauE/DoxX family redox-associated membrane protein [Rothia halotolerans]|uniref:MauE/DoxX family redox-associated membrane protein n=1 Tax=Rothia halotolerans TaxID=405770 RepID=UPI00101CA505|nr:MauE/DoxX family redox-associated membrane protein [Rothia halotolerans]
MPAVAVAPALILAVVLAVSGAAKTRAPEAVRRAFSDLRVPALLDRRWIRVAFPAAEALLALALLAAPGAAAPAAATLAVLLFGAYWLLIRRALGFEAPVACACFGEADAAPVTRRTLARNTVLLLLAVLWWVLSWIASAPALLARFALADWLWLTVGLTGATVLLLAWPGASGRSRHAAEGADRPSAPERGTTSRPGASSPLDGARGFPESVPEDARLLLHLAPGCASCARVLRLAPGWAGRLGPVRLQLISMAAPEAVRVVAPEELWERILPAAEQPELAALGIPSAPSAVLLAGSGEALAAPAEGAEAVEALVGRIAGARS